MIDNLPTYAPASELEDWLHDIMRPAEVQTLSEWSDRHRIISPEANPTEYGPWRTARAEYLRGPMDAFTDAEHQEVVIMKSSRSGLTAAIVENGIAYHIASDPATIMLTLPTKDKAIGFAKKNLDPLIRDNETISNRIRPPRAKDSNTTKLFKPFEGGSLTVVWAGSPASFRGDTYRVFMGDDVDGFPVSAGSEGDPASLGKRRTITVWNRKIVLISSPTVAGISRIALEFSISDQRHFYVPCPHCRHAQILVFGKQSMWVKPTQDNIIGNLAGRFAAEHAEYHIGLKFDKENCTWATYVCEKCQKEIDETEKVAMVRGGHYIAANPSVTDIAGFHVSELLSDFNTSWTRIAKEFLEAKQSAETLKVFVNNVLGETFDEEAFQISEHFLQQRVKDYIMAPKACFLLSAGADIQGDRIEYFVWGWGLGDECWLIDHQIIIGNPYDELTWSKLDAYINETRYKHESGIPLKPFCTFVDSGDFTDEAYRFTAPREKRWIFASKGYDKPRALVATGKTRDKQTGAKLMILGVDEAKGRLYSMIKGEKEGPGYVHLNMKATAEFCRQLIAEKYVRFINKAGKIVKKWILPAGRRNEALDGWVMAYCAMRYRRPVMPIVKKEFEKKVEAMKQQPAAQKEEKQGEEPEVRRAPKIRRRKGWQILP